MRSVELLVVEQDKFEKIVDILKKNNLWVSDKCIGCRKTVDESNFGGLIQANGKIRFFCDNPECYMKAISKARKENGNGKV